MIFFCLTNSIITKSILNTGQLTELEANQDQVLVKHIHIDSSKLKILPDLISKEFLSIQYHIISDQFKKLISLYYPNTIWTPFIMIDQYHDQYLYWYWRPIEIDCISENTSWNRDGLIKTLILDKSKMTSDSIFQIKTKLQKKIIIRIDVAESILRRSLIGIEWIKIEVENK